MCYGWRYFVEMLPDSCPAWEKKWTINYPVRAGQFRQHQYASYVKTLTNLLQIQIVYVTGEYVSMALNKEKNCE